VSDTLPQAGRASCDTSRNHERATGRGAGGKKDEEEEDEEAEEEKDEEDKEELEPVGNTDVCLDAVAVTTSLSFSRCTNDLVGSTGRIPTLSSHPRLFLPSQTLPYVHRTLEPSSTPKSSRLPAGNPLLLSTGQWVPKVFAS
jgi:hypothetical protein